MLPNNITIMNINEITASISNHSDNSNLNPINSNNIATPVFKNLNLSTIALSRKNIDLKPNIANMLEKNTTYGSLDTENIAGILSKANTKSLVSITTTVNNNGVINHFPLSEIVNSPFYPLLHLVKKLSSTNDG